MPRKILQRLLTCKGGEEEGGGYRRSPRLCSIESWKKAQKSKQQIMGEKKLGPCLRSRMASRGRRKTRDLSPVDEEDSESPSEEDTPSNKAQPKRSSQLVEPSKLRDHEAIPNRQQSVMLCESHMPDKSRLQLVIDILQRRDTNEIFAQPVDANEVEDYYEIIDEPMDFGTMRAKLHEGMYKNLEQFENDVFLIFRNAMHFNASGTMYYKQARAIDELAKKVFHVLKTEPENLESEFSSTRRRPGRRFGAEPTLSLSPKCGLNLRSRNSGTDPWLKDAQRSLDGSFKSRSIFQTTPVCFGGKATPICSSAQETLYSGLVGAKDWWSTPNSIEDDRRATYKSSFSTSSNPKTLVPENQQDLSYSESLMMFCKNLGPTAQIVAKRKLQMRLSDPPVYQTPSSSIHIQEPKIQNHAVGSFLNQWRACPARTNISDGNSLINADIVQKPSNGFIHVQQPKMDSETSPSKYADLMAIDRTKLTASNFPPIKTVFTIDDLNLKPTSCLTNGIGSSLKTNQHFETNQPIIKTVSTIDDLNLLPPLSPDDRIGRSSNTNQVSENNHLTTQYGSQYVFDLPYLKARLSEMNSIAQQDLFLRQCADTQSAFFQ